MKNFMVFLSDGKICFVEGEFVGVSGGILSVYIDKHQPLSIAAFSEGSWVSCFAEADPKIEE